MSGIILFAVGMLVYLYGGYVLLLKVLTLLFVKKTTTSFRAGEYPVLTVLITVHNEAKNIEARIENILSCTYPRDKLEVLVASDGSNDETDDIVNNMTDTRVHLFHPAIRKGKTDTQNQAVATAHGEIIIFTDADTRFDRQFLKEIVNVFVDPQVGGADGHLLFLTESADGISRSQGFYWKQELQIRQLESSLGMLAVASGACMAIRRKLFRPMQATVGEDCLIPLDVVDQGFRMVHVSTALAYDKMEHEPEREFRTRVRMTLRNWQGTWSYPQLLNPLAHPGIAWALWSHKVLRWLSPVFLLMWLSGSLGLLVTGGEHAWLGIPGALFMLAALAGAVRLPLPGVAAAYSFCLANAGFLVGVTKAVLGKKIMSYR